MLAMDDEQARRQRRAVEHRLMRRLQARARLVRMLEYAQANPVEATLVELGRMKAYLADWVRWQQDYWPQHLRMPRPPSWAATETRVRTATEYTERSDRWAMDVVQRAVEEDLLGRPEGSAMRAALRVRWLNEAVGARVFRHGRLAPLYPHEVDALADRGELELVEIVKKHGLPL